MATTQSEARPENTGIIYRANNYAFKTSDKHTLLATTYALNNSNTKKIVVGLGLRKDYEFEPVVRLMNSSSIGICLQLDTWISLLESAEIISAYLDCDINSDAQFWCDSIDLGGCHVTFTTAHGVRAIRFDDPTRAPGTTQTKDNENYDDCSPPKQQKLFQPAIVMQKPTFEGLKSITACVQERLRILEKLLPEVNKCKKLFVEYIAQKVKTTVLKDPSTKVITETVKTEYQATKEIMNPQLESMFAANFFDIALLEITTLFPSCVTAEVKKLTIMQTK